MIQSIAIDGVRDKTVHSELSCGGYITADDDVALPNYLLYLPIQNDVTMEIDVE